MVWHLFVLALHRVVLLHLSFAFLCSRFVSLCGCFTSLCVVLSLFLVICPLLDWMWLAVIQCCQFKERLRPRPLGPLGLCGSVIYSCSRYCIKVKHDRDIKTSFLDYIFCSGHMLLLSFNLLCVQFSKAGGGS